MNAIPRRSHKREKEREATIADFNQLMELFNLTKGNIVMEPLMESLADRCVHDADRCKAGWDFETWKEYMVKEYKIKNQDSFEQKRGYLVACRNFFDHFEGGSRRVLSNETQLAIRFLHELLIEKQKTILANIIPHWFRKQAIVLLRERGYLRGGEVWFYDEGLRKLHDEGLRKLMKEGGG